MTLTAQTIALFLIISPAHDTSGSAQPVIQRIGSFKTVEDCSAASRQATFSSEDTRDRLGASFLCVLEASPISWSGDDAAERQARTLVIRRRD